MLDAADVFLYVFTLNLVRADFGLTDAQAAIAATVIYGVLARRIASAS